MLHRNNVCIMTSVKDRMLKAETHVNKLPATRQNYMGLKLNTLSEHYSTSKRVSALQKIIQTHCCEMFSGGAFYIVPARSTVQHCSLPLAWN